MTSFLKRMDWISFAAIVALTALGVAFIWSAGSARSMTVLQNLWRGHLVTALFGFALYFVCSAIDYRIVLKWFSKPYFAVSLFFLVAVLVFGAKVYGGRRWLWFFQPSELAKLSVVMLMSQFFGENDGRRFGFRGFLLGLAICGVPAFLILAEPDLGTALVLVPTAFAMMLAARVWVKGLITLFVIALLSIGLVLGTVWAAEHQSVPERREQIIRRLPLKEHQIKRLRVFVNPSKDIHGAGYNLRQAKISIGSGSITGKGFGKGEQKFLGFLPPSVSMNDFIFAVLAEEAGFAGSMTVLILFAILLGGGLITSIRADDDRGRLYAIGLVTLIFCHVYVNVAMSIGLMPITGLPLPFISAGRTFLIVLLTGLGLLQSINTHSSNPERK